MAGVIDRFRLDGKIAVVAGGGGAIGSALAQMLSSAGACLTVTDRSAEPLEETKRIICDRGANALAVSGDMTLEEDAERVIAATLDTYGKVDIIINAIGGGAGKVLFDAEEYPRDAWDWIYEINVRATLLPTQAAVRAMVAAGKGGRVVNISSVRGQLGINAGYSAYVAAKGAVSALTRQWATEWAKHGITVNAIAPTFVDTPQVAMLLGDPAFKSALLARIPIGRVGTPEDLFGAVLLFCSDAGSFLTGQILTIDGGLTATQ
jgi:NAD(P)-dependent dehydrogenase (short-subunit alcohol dehydrogenase family)